ncbi:Rieske 2Fe-2S domain-containing protein [Streptomyces sp. HUAS MG47]|uniref:Rieske 2Fe-2S domain-containing protein n=1 Tax=Streptomyces solicamelliae TaxID=3231716 RepID=UPI00387816BE
MDRIENSPRADWAVVILRRTVRGLPLGPVRDVLHGRWLGHPLHPLLVQFPIGVWLSAAVLDLLPGHHRAARVLVGAGLAGAAPAALSGWADWAELRRPQMRVGLLHAAANITGVACYANSFAARCRGRHLRGEAWAFCGLAAIGVGGALGGHLAYRQAAGANHAEEVPALVEPGWHDLGEVADLPEDLPRQRQIGEIPVVIVRLSDGQVHVLSARCSHMGGPLAEGAVIDSCVRCPWHGSTFRLSDGWNVTGPATAPQPAFETRTVEGRLEARLPSRYHASERNRTSPATTDTTSSSATTSSRYSADAEDDILEQLIQQHERIRRLLAETLDADGDAKQRFFDELRGLLAVHEAAEEMILRPVAKRVVGKEEADARNEEESSANEALAELEKLDVHSEEFNARLIAFQEAVDDHAQHEEREEFSAIGARCDIDERRSMGRRLRMAQRVAPTHPHPAAAGSTAAQWTIGPFAALMDRAKDAFRSTGGP